jgi:hypothetical protein
MLKLTVRPRKPALRYWPGLNLKLEMIDQGLFIVAQTPPAAMRR